MSSLCACTSGYQAALITFRIPTQTRTKHILASNPACLANLSIYHSVVSSRYNKPTYPPVSGLIT